uniref:Uncharacterized protein n=1 Tax=Cacopsylla melanoneura TaxID=428564 RepID=A0A8D8XNH6_9HEMI
MKKIMVMILKRLKNLKETVSLTNNKFIKVRNFISKGSARTYITNLYSVRNFYYSTKVCFDVAICFHSYFFVFFLMNFSYAQYSAVLFVIHASMLKFQRETFQFQHFKNVRIATFNLFLCFICVVKLHVSIIILAILFSVMHVYRCKIFEI